MFGRGLKNKKKYLEYVFCYGNHIHFLYFIKQLTDLYMRMCVCTPSSGTD